MLVRRSAEWRDCDRVLEIASVGRKLLYLTKPGVKPTPPYRGSGISPSQVTPVQSPPYCATETTLDCPSCGAKASVRVREQMSYFDGSDYPGFCAECHAALTVWASVEVLFTDVEVSS